MTPLEAGLRAAARVRSGAVAAMDTVGRAHSVNSILVSAAQVGSVVTPPIASSWPDPPPEDMEAVTHGWLNGFDRQAAE